MGADVLPFSRLLIFIDHYVKVWEDCKKGRAAISIFGEHCAILDYEVHFLPDDRTRDKMKLKMILIGILIVIWWIGLWGLIETCIQHITQGHPFKSGCVYTFMILFVILVVFMYPNLENNII